MNRFLAIVVIVALGVAFFTGLKAVGPDMNHTATLYFNATDMMDYKLVSNLGFTEEDVEIVSTLDYIDHVAPAYSLDALLEENDSSRVVHVMSLIDSGTGMNGLTVVEGRLPESANECVIDNGKQNRQIAVGDEIDLVSGTENELSEKLATTEYTVVGIVNAPNYLNRERGSSAIGSGRVTGLVYVPVENFLLDVYTELYATIAGSGDVSAFGADYDALAQAQDEQMDALAAEREQLRYEEVLKEANDTLAEKQAELDDARDEAEQDLADAQAKLDDAGVQLADGEQKLADARDEADDKFADADAAISKSEKKVKSGRAEYKENLAAYEEKVAASEPLFEAVQEQIDAATEQIAQQVAAVDALRAQLAQNGTQVPLTDEQICALQLKIADGEAEITEATAHLDAAQFALDSLADHQDDLNAQISAQKAELASFQNKLETGTKPGMSDDDIAALERKIADSEIKIDELNGQLSAAQDALTNAQQCADDLRAQLNAQNADLRSTEDALAQGIADKSLTEDEIAQYQAQIGAAQSAVDETSAQLVSAQSEVTSLGQQVSDLAAQIASEQADVDAAQAKLNAGKEPVPLTDGEKATLQSKIDACETEIASLTDALQPIETDITEAQDQIDELHATLSDQEAAVKALQDQLQAGYTIVALTDEEVAALQDQIAAGEAALTDAQAQVDASIAELAAQKQSLTDAGDQLDQAKTNLDDASAQIKKKKSSLASAKKEAEDKFAEAENEIAEKQIELTDAQTELDDAKVEADEKITDAQQQLDDAKDDIADIPEGNWIVLGRDDNAGYADFDAAITRTDGLASIFPIFFFLIAALVCLTTMTRMVDEQRTQIGTFKALGYGRGAIAFQYLFYAGAASVIGSAIGLTFGFLVFPKVIMMAYEKLYTLPDLVLTFCIKDAAIAVALAMGATVVATFFTCWRELTGVPAQLMRPQAPTAGKRVLLERIPFLWKRLSFSQKVTARNLLRYKKRFWMTVLGVASCTALLLTGLGLRDSAATQVSDRQFGELFLYDIAFQVKDDMSAEDAEAIETALTEVGAEKTPLRNESVTVGGNAVSEESSLMIPTEPDAFTNYIALRDPSSGRAIAVPESGAVVTQKLAENLGVSPGDQITLTDVENRQATVEVVAIAENYLSHYVVLSQDAYVSAFGLDAVVNQYLVNLPDGVDEEAKTALSETLMALDGVSGLRDQEENMDTFHDIIKSLDYIVWVILFAAAALAFAVLYTLTSINISERFREIATIKVLGFYDRETAAYIFRESYILTALGAGLGMVLGIFVHGMVLDSIEVDAVMYVRQILPVSYAISLALSLIFTWIVNRLAIKKLSKINMVEALKGVE